ncbi:Ig-like domain-containing protein [Cyclonatronum proteinivorum]|uniref:Ig-like domain-containing protein n=1 Tax=Cyclonatronum proteinivorum TaxID=1457365 RepID=A0A345UKT5_9BACT|nr:Ig-like domain-containing protein [Cyclonatronum proteinivorum]AXJ01087.1 Ig-like domain-containing protein [Cyclonatronum proteinivorum]
MTRIFGFLFLCLIAGLSLTYCATPTQPTGGPPDTTPPRIISTYPQNGTVNFSGNEIRFDFDKYMNRQSFGNAFRIDPIAGVRYDVNWRGRSVRVRFEQPLPDSTTVIFTLGTELSDHNRNRLDNPFVLALSTGDTIDEGEIEGRIIDARTGRGKRDAFVFLYRFPFDLEARASYVAETDTAGRVAFTHLAEGVYRAIWVDDRNRNRRWDRANEVARPFYRETVRVQDGQPAGLGTLFVNEPDTTRPTLQGIGLFSSTRLRLRYSRDMMIQPEAEITILDSLGTAFTQAVPLFADKQQADVVFAQALRPLPENQTFTLRSQGVTDLRGNEPRTSDRIFTGSSDPDTTHVRMTRHLTERGVRGSEPMIFEFSTLLAGTSVVDSLEVVQDEVIYEAWEPLEVQDNLLFLFPPDVWDEASDYTIRIYDERAGTRRNIQTRILPRGELGSLHIRIAEGHRLEGVNHHISVLDRDGAVVFEGITEDELTVENLPQGRYTVLAFRDDDGDGRWFRGDVEPFRAPEPFLAQRNVEVHGRMEGELDLEYPHLPGRTDDPEADPNEEPIESGGEPEDGDVRPGESEAGESGPSEP